MTKERLSTEEAPTKASKRHEVTDGEISSVGRSRRDPRGLSSLLQRVGNQAVQRLIQRSGEGPTDLDEDTAEHINRERGGGRPLDSSVSEQLGSAMDQDFKGVQVHTSQESDDLNRQLGAKAFTTGTDIFFREGAYQPQSSAGRELIAHELTHVTQQSSGAVGSGGGQMQVNAPGDAFEQEAEGVAKAVTGTGASSELQRQDEGLRGQLQAQDEEEQIQAQTSGEEEEELQMKAEGEEVQMQPEEEEEEELQMQPMEEEEEELQMQVDEEEEELA